MVTHLIAWVVAAAVPHQALAQAGAAADVAAIRAAATAYREALARGDEPAIQAAWAPDGDIVDGWGRRFMPQDSGAIDGGGADAMKPRPRYLVGETNLRFITTDVAVEDGTVDVVLPGMKTAVEGWFSALWVRTASGWKLAGVRESERPVVADVDMLEDLDWLVGDWVLEAGETGGAAASAESSGPADMEMAVRWDAGHAFLIRDVRVPVAPSEGDGPGMVELHQRIGWDPLVRRVRSWSFSSDGSRGEATWFRDGDSWVAIQTGIMPEGRQVSAVNIYSYDGRDRCVWRTLPEALDSTEDLPTRTTWVRRPKGAIP